MEIKTICENYFSAINEILNYKKNDNQTTALAFLKILSYFTVVIPMAVLAVYGVSSLCGRVCKKQELSAQDQKADAQAKKALGIPNKATSTPEGSSAPLDEILISVGEPAKPGQHSYAFSQVSSSEITDKILAASPWKKGERYSDAKGYVYEPKGYDFIASVIRSKDFLENPTRCLVNIMINRGVGGENMLDRPRAFIISRIPNFAQIVKYVPFLREIAEVRFDKKANKKEIMSCIEGMFASQDIRKSLDRVAEKLQASIDQKDSQRFRNAEGELRVLFDVVFNQAERNPHNITIASPEFLKKVNGL